jgi:hypothetical protein
LGPAPGDLPEVRDRPGQIMTSPEFTADMAGFDFDDIVEVEATLLDPTSFSPLR